MSYKQRELRTFEVAHEELRQMRARPPSERPLFSRGDIFKDDCIKVAFYLLPERVRDMAIRRLNASQELRALLLSELSQLLEDHYDELLREATIEARSFLQEHGE